MLSLLTPKLYVNTIYDVDLKGLLNLGIRSLIFDLDNTLVRWGTSEVSDELKSLMGTVALLGFNSCILSNNFKERSRNIAEILGIRSIGGALKPATRGFLRAARLLGSNPHEVAVIGDQLFTDILGGNRAGMFTILVKPLWQREFISTKIVRRVERTILNSLEQQGSLNNCIHPKETVNEID